MNQKTFQRENLTYRLSCQDNYLQIWIECKTGQQWNVTISDSDHLSVNEIYARLGSDSVIYPSIGPDMTSFIYHPFHFDLEDNTIDVYPVGISRQIVPPLPENDNTSRLVDACIHYTYNNLIHLYQTSDIKPYLDKIDPITGHTPLTAICTREPEILLQFLSMDPNLDIQNAYHHTPIDLVYGLALPLNALILINAGVTRKPYLKWGELTASRCPDNSGIDKICYFCIHPDTSIDTLNGINPLCTIFKYQTEYMVFNPAKIVQDILSRGGDVNETDDYPLIVLVIYAILNPLRYTDNPNRELRSGLVELLKMIIAYGADINCMSNHLGEECNLLQIALSWKKIIPETFEIVKLLVDNGIDIDKSSKKNTILDTYLRHLIICENSPHYGIDQHNIVVVEDIYKYIISMGFHFHLNRIKKQTHMPLIIRLPNLTDWFNFKDSDQVSNAPLEHPLHVSMNMAEMIIRNISDINRRNSKGKTLLHKTSDKIIALLLIERGMDVHAEDKYKRTPLHYAKNAAVAEVLISHGANVHAEDKLKHTPLHCTCNAAVAEVLISHGANVHAENKYRYTPLHRTKNADVAEVLIRHGADLHARGLLGKTPLDCVSSVEVAEVLIRHGANVRAENKSKYTPLHWTRNASVAEVLIAHGASVHAQDKYGRSPLHRADNYKITEVLIRHNAVVNAQDIDGCTPLHRAKNAKIAEILISHGADINAENKQGHSPIFCVENADVVQVLIGHGANVIARDKDGRTPLHMIRSRRYCYVTSVASGDAIEVLIKHGADIHAMDKNGQTPLHMASTRGIDELIKHGADIHAKDLDGMSPLHYACYAGITEKLIKYGANVNKRGKWYRTPLHMVSDIYATEVLIENGADVNAKDIYGDTPLHLAKNGGIAEILIKNGADVNARDTYGYTPLHLAKDCGIVEKLIKNGADVNAVGKMGKTPLHKINCDINTLTSDTSDEKRNNRLLKTEGFRIAEKLVRHGADINAVDENGRTPLHTVKNIGAATFLIDNSDTMIDSTDKNGCTPLHLVKNVQIADLLISHGSSVYKKNSSGLSPLSAFLVRNNITATQFSELSPSNQEMIMLFIDHGSDISSYPHLKRVA
jgi:ankyrin repeat protein